MTQRHPDIEIYIKDRSPEQILQWLAQRFDGVECSRSRGLVHELRLQLNQQRLPVQLHERVSGKAWSSLWFKSDATPWNVDLECAREAAVALQTQVRCVASGWQEGDEPDEWWRVTDQDEEKILWRTE